MRKKTRYQSRISIGDRVLEIKVVKVSRYKKVGLQGPQDLASLVLVHRTELWKG